MIINLYINGCKKSLDVRPDEYLSEVLRRYGYLSVKRACDTGCCGVCTILIDGKPILSCSYFAVRAENKHITTIEGISDEEKKLGELLVSEGAEQCGYCSPGLILTVIAMKNELKNPTKRDISQYLTGNLCRCTGYVGQLRGIMKYMEVKE
ncbi:2Fe-2S iron-sulfur cluster binding domain-containing protein [Tissierella carlieri]|uniref:2Fe-2S iron-sulfur cluster-binding protein n=1 Tax=Tissierella carlieri TaxID=689904 RepID=A0ABT1SDN1_9FIRM|nr:2Fe-2S iron-sulfur cluster-binding protein [Tissierella carlieri]MBU5311116.1 2Fe-2S iron-sulfur cluster binding domain-containing protein [Tissierella carlieri]MCQ4924568.1 2Fe-2S iron-sulfur cluster-binding protein [Tissierella carlieri]